MGIQENRVSFKGSIGALKDGERRWEVKHPGVSAGKMPGVEPVGKSKLQPMNPAMPRMGKKGK
jgi:hypothetical protein